MKFFAVLLFFVSAMGYSADPQILQKIEAVENALLPYRVGSCVENREVGTFELAIQGCQQFNSRYVRLEKGKVLYVFPVTKEVEDSQIANPQTFWKVDTVVKRFQYADATTVQVVESRYETSQSLVSSAYKSAMQTYKEFKAEEPNMKPGISLSNLKGNTIARQFSNQAQRYADTRRDTQYEDALRDHQELQRERIKLRAQCEEYRIQLMRLQRDQNQINRCNQ